MTKEQYLENEKVYPLLMQNKEYLKAMLLMNKMVPHFDKYYNDRVTCDYFVFEALSICQKELKLYRDAIKSLTKLIEFQGTNTVPRILKLRSELKILSNDMNGSQDDLAKASKIILAEKIWSQTIESGMWLGDPKGVILELSKALDLWPESQKIKFDRARAKLHLKMIKDAEEEFNEVVDSIIWPKNKGNLYFQMARSFSQNNYAEKSVEYYNKACRIDPALKQCDL